MPSTNERPEFRPAEVISEQSALDAFASGDAERVRLALIDGSRCLNDSWVFPHAWRFVTHSDPGIRWAAVFALDQVRAELIKRERVHRIAVIAAGSDDHEVRLVEGNVAVEPRQHLPRRLSRNARIEGVVHAAEVLPQAHVEPVQPVVRASGMEASLRIGGPKPDNPGHRFAL